jgi:PAT family beta-lactamase induction signal transducer AmpG
MRHKAWGLILIFVILFKLGDALALMMTSPFLIELGFTKTEIAAVVKTFGLIATFLGIFLGGAMVARLGMMRALLWCALAQMLSILMFIVQARAGHDTLMLAFTNSAENLAAGMGSAAFVAYISSLCNRAYTATQYALLSSLAAVGRTVFASLSGFVVDAVGWVWFFLFSMAACLPGMILLWMLYRMLGNSGKGKRKA